MGEAGACITTSLHASVVHRARSAEEGTLQPTWVKEGGLGLLGRVLSLTHS